MQIASVEHEGARLAVALEGERAVPLRGIAELGRDTPLALLRAAELDRAGALPLDAVHFRPVVPRPGKVICVGLNYRAHIEETGRGDSDYPVLFTKFATSVAGPFDPIALPAESSGPDYEGELVVVIGERARRISKADAMRAVAGFAVANDVTMRDYQARTHQWLQGKAWDACTPVGPALVTLDELPDPGRLTLRTTLGGETVQEASTELMIFDVATLVATISEFATLEPGDLILTGTPSGVGFTREPPLVLADGDVVAVEIEGVGRIENRFVAEA